MLDVVRQLLQGSHRVPKQAVLLSSLFCFVVNELVSKVLFNLLASVFFMQIGCFLRYVLVKGVETGLLQWVMVVIRVTVQLAMQIIEVDAVLPKNFMVKAVFGLLIVRVGMDVLMEVCIVCDVMVMWQVGQRGICNEFVVSFHAMVGVFDVSLDHIEAHLKDIVVFKGVPEALLLMLSVDVTEFLGAFGMLDSHLKRLKIL